MEEESTERQRGNPVWHTGLEVGRNLRRVRRERSLSIEDVSERLAWMLRPIPAASLGKMETGRRKIEVDDLMALAVVLDVSPLVLLLPDTRRAAEAAQITGGVASASALWRWALTIEQLRGEWPNSFARDCRPGWITEVGMSPGLTNTSEDEAIRLFQVRQPREDE